MGGITPDIPKAYILAVVVSVLGVATAFGLHITKQQQYSIEGLCTTVSVGLIWGYNHLAKHRLQHLAALQAVKANQPVLAATGRVKADGDPQLAPAQPTDQLGY